MWTRKDSGYNQVDTTRKDREDAYWRIHPHETLEDKWDGFLWNKANTYIKDRDARDDAVCLSTHLRVVHIAV